VVRVAVRVAGGALGAGVFDLLHRILTFLSIEMVKDLATKEVELTGVSSGSRAVAGGHSNSQKSVVASEVKDAET
jgi:hypothetical protein